MPFKSNTCKKIFFIVLFWAYPVSLLAVTPPIPAQPSQYVMDLAGVMDSNTRTRLNAMLKDLEANTTAQVVVLTLNSLEGEPIETFSHQTAVKWGIGQKGKDNGVLITVAVKDRKYRFEVGYGLEATLPDSLVGSIGRGYLVPNFRKGDFSTGIVTAVTEVINKISNKDMEVPSNDADQTAAPPENATPDQREKPNQLGLVILICFIIVMLPIIALTIPRIWAAKKRGGRVGFWTGGSGGGWSSGGGDSGGFGGGGGDFGGGGASGDW